jgi:hypothetical protein
MLTLTGLAPVVYARSIRFVAATYCQPGFVAATYCHPGFVVATYF